MSARYRTRVLIGLFVSIIVVLGFMDADPNGLNAAPSRCPQYEAALASRGLPVAFFSHRMYLESHCNPLAVNANRHTQDLSLGLLGHNLFTAEARRAYVAAGFTYPVLLTVGGNLNATVWRYNLCGTGPWTKTKHGYGCTPPKKKAVYR